jgi:structural maintenance of chromosome 1
MSKKSIRDSEKQCSKQEDDIRALETELVGLDSAWRNFEKQIEEEIVHKGRDIELEASQVKMSKYGTSFPIVYFSF